MAIGTPFVPMVVAATENGVISNLTPSQVGALGTIKTATAPFSISHNGVLISLQNGEPVLTDASLTAAFSAANAPVA